MLKIIRESDPIPVNRIVMLLYGQPGIGKTSLGFTAEKPLLLDFDDGAHRGMFRKDAVAIGDWSEVSNLSPEDLAPYKTIVVDTGGRALDKITAHMVRQDAKLGSKTGGLSLQGYGALKSTFSTWVRQLQQLGKDIVILAHDKEDKKGDELLIRPDFQGGSYQEVVKVADCIAYMHQVNGKRVLDFSPTDMSIGKNCAGLAPIAFPDFAEGSDCLARIIADTKAALNKQTEAQKQALGELADWTAKFTEATSAADFDKLLAEGGKVSAGVKAQVKRALIVAAKAKGFEFLKGAKGFTAIPKAPEAPAQTGAQAAA